MTSSSKGSPLGLNVHVQCTTLVRDFQAIHTQELTQVTQGGGSGAAPQPKPLRFCFSGQEAI